MACHAKADRERNVAITDPDGILEPLLEAVRHGFKRFGLVDVRLDKGELVIADPRDRVLWAGE